MYLLSNQSIQKVWLSYGILMVDIHSGGLYYTNFNGVLSEIGWYIATTYTRDDIWFMKSAVQIRQILSYGYFDRQSTSNGGMNHMHVELVNLNWVQVVATTYTRDTMMIAKDRICEGQIVIYGSITANIDRAGLYLNTMDDKLTALWYATATIQESTPYGVLSIFISLLSILQVYLFLYISLHNKLSFP